MFKINIRIWSKIPVSLYLQIACYWLVYTQMCEESFCEHFLQFLNPMSINMCGAHTACQSFLCTFVDYYGIEFQITMINYNCVLLS